MKVRDLIQVLSKLDWDKEIEIGEYLEGFDAYHFKNGCVVYEEVETGNYVILPNLSGCAEKK